MTTQKWINCLVCDNSFSLPAGEPFDDGSISDKDRLVCKVEQDAPFVVPENGHCARLTITFRTE